MKKMVLVRLREERVKLRARVKVMRGFTRELGDQLSDLDRRILVLERELNQ